MALAAALDAPEYPLFSFDAQPKWVEQVELPSARLTKDNDAPLHYIFLSYQDRIANNQIEHYMRRVFQINDESHIEDNSHSLHELSPESESIVFHRCVIYRAGKCLDRLDKQNVRALKRETGLERQLISDRVTLELLIDDLRVGDIVDIEATTTEYAGPHSLYGRIYHSSTLLNWGLPVGEMLHRVVNDGALNITLNHKNSEQDVDKRRQLAPGETVTWHKNNLDMVGQSDFLPYWYWPNCMIATSTQSWSEISSYLHQQNEQHGVLNTELDSEQIKEIEDIDWQDQSMRNVTRIVRFVQDNIRYRAESNGIHTHTPKCVSETLRRRTGDCKDKSALLVVLLERIGIDAELTLVSTYLKDNIATLSPSPYWFNHMIVRVLHEGQHYVVDPTMQKQGGMLDTQARLDYRLCLPLRTNGSDLVEIPRDDSVLLFERRDEIDLRFDTLDQCTVRVERTFYQERADNMRFHLASKNKSELEEGYLNHSKDEFKVNLTPEIPYHILQDDRVANILRTEEVYRIQGKLEELEEKIISFSFDGHSDFAMPTSDTHPVVTGETGLSRHMVTVHYGYLPEKINDAFEEKNPLFEYRDSMETIENRIDCYAEFRALAEYASVDQVKPCRKAIARVQNRSRTNLLLKLHLETETSVADHAWYLYPIGLWLVWLVASENGWLQNPSVMIGFVVAAGFMAAMKFKPHWFKKS